ncbi:MAG TPA: hypothetical protein VIQ29_06405 [Ancylobacter sp.]
MSKLFAFAPALMPALLGPLVACATFGASPAQAQYYYRPYYEPRYVEPLYDEPPPGYYYRAPPRVYRQAPPPFMPRGGMIPLADVQPLLRSIGLVSVGRPRADGNTYVTDATTSSGERVRVRLDARSGAIISMNAIAQPAPVARRAPLPPVRPAEIETTALPAPVTAPEPAMPIAAVPPAEKPVATEPVPEPPKQAAAPATAPSEVRVIPGVALPPGTAPKTEAKATEAKVETPPAAPAPSTPAAPAGNSTAGTGTGTGTGTAAGSVSAGTASVAARDGKPPAPTAD